MACARAKFPRLRSTDVYWPGGQVAVGLPSEVSPTCVWAAEGMLGCGAHTHALAAEECRGRGQTAATALGISPPK